MPTVTLKAGDTTPEFETDLSEDIGDDEPDPRLEDASSVRFYMDAPPESDGGERPLIVNQPATNYKAGQGEVSYDFSDGETSRVGEHHAEIVVTYTDGEVRTFPNEDQYYVVDINEPVNRDVPPEDLDDPDITVGVVDAEQVNAPTLQAVETLTGSLTGGQTLSDIAGPNLSIQNGELTAGDVQESANHYNTTYDSDEDGTIDADVDNELVDTRELSVSGWSAGKALNQDNFSNFTEHIGYQVSVSGSSDHEMFSVSEPVDVIVGTVVGNVTRDLTVTWDDGTSDSFYNGTARGRDSDGDGISFNPIPPLEDVTALAFRNASDSSDVYGYKVITV